MKKLNQTDNELIAEFMGLNNGKWWHLTRHELEYYTSWDWLMPVVEKIAMMGFHFQMYRLKPQSRVEVYGIQYHSKHIEGFEVEKGTPFIGITYKAVVEFIKWYNEQSK